MQPLASQGTAVAPSIEDKKSSRIPPIRMCIFLICLFLLTLALSLSLALWWAETHDDISGGFTVGSYIVAIAGIPIGLASLIHFRSCKCWECKGSRQECSRSEDIALETLNAV